MGKKKMEKKGKKQVEQENREIQKFFAHITYKYASPTVGWRSFLLCNIVYDLLRNKLHLLSGPLPRATTISLFPQALSSTPCASEGRKVL